MLVVRRDRLSTMEDLVALQPRRVEVGRFCGHVIAGHVILVAGARVCDAHFEVVVPLQTEETPHHHRHVSTVWSGDAGDVQLTVDGQRVTSVAWMILSARRLRRRRPLHGDASVAFTRYNTHSPVSAQFRDVLLMTTR